VWVFLAVFSRARPSLRHQLLQQPRLRTGLVFHAAEEIQELAFELSEGEERASRVHAPRLLPARTRGAVSGSVLETSTTDRRELAAVRGHGCARGAEGGR